MRDTVKVTGMVILAAPVGEYDKRLVILTRERGKITAFARGARRPGNSLMAVGRTFVFGTFRLFEGREAYTLHSAEIANYFEEIAGDMEAACYGSYFLEICDYYSRENAEGSELLKLVYQSLRALLKPAIPNPLVRRVFELKAMVINGEYTEKAPRQVCDSAAYTWEYVVASPVETLYRFTVTDQVLREFGTCVDANMARFIDRRFKSLEILEAMRF